MDAALGRYDEYIDIRDPAVFATWQKTPGLRCLVCRHPVTVYHSSAQNPFVRHGKGFGATGDRTVKTSARETFLHFRLKHWVCAQLRALGSEDARVETHLEARTPDVFGHLHGRGYAVEVQWSRLDHAVAEARTRDLLAEGADEVLWLTRPCTWAEKLPVLGITSFNPGGDDYEAHTGFLTYQQHTGARSNGPERGQNLRRRQPHVGDHSRRLMPIHPRVRGAADTPTADTHSNRTGAADQSPATRYHPRVPPPRSTNPLFRNASSTP
ncbi:hypothetical protein [Nocardia vulneris]|uniref:Competence protein CoiA n=1 Tax=Nocardia vulneris TaxID=1141657 RepID=A0ABR4Z4X0_9NOCA|nr:hypothetical protein [Nocardia vulneris]KIA60378.1 hypothetical protein FG87_37180 [Nocardia vulneris]